MTIYSLARKISVKNFSLNYEDSAALACTSDI